MKKAKIIVGLIFTIGIVWGIIKVFIKYKIIVNLANENNVTQLIYVIAVVFVLAVFYALFRIIVSKILKERKRRKAR